MIKRILSFLKNPTFLHLQLLFFVSLTLVAIWFRKGILFGGAEEGLQFYDLNIIYDNISTVWLDLFLGLPNITEPTKIPFFSILVFLNGLGFPNFFLQVATFFIILFFAGTAVYFLLKITLGKYQIPDSISLIGALFYLLNPYSMSQVWTRGLYTQFFAFVYLPVFLLFFVLANEKKQFIYTFMGLLAGFFLSAAFGNPAYAVGLWVLIGGFLVFYLSSNLITYKKNRSENKSGLIFGCLNFVVVLTGWILSNIYWIVIYLDLAPKTFLTSGSVFDNSIESLKAVSGSFPFSNVIRLVQKGYFFENSWYGDIYTWPFFQLISYLVPVISLFGFWGFKKIPTLWFFGFIFLLGLFVVLGANPPFGEIFIWFFNQFPQLQIFRNPYEKFGLVFVLGLTPFFGLGVYKIYQLFGKKSFFLLIPVLFLTMGVYIWPMWNGRVISWGTQSSPPFYYSQFSDWLNQENQKGYRIFFVPFLPDLGAAYKWGRGEYHGTDPIYQIVPFSTVSQSGKNEYLVALRENISRINLVPALKLIGANLLVVRDDVVANIPEQKQQNYLLDSYYPFDPQHSFNVDCEAGVAVTKNESYIKAVCHLSENQSDWSSIKYIHLAVKTEKPSLLDFNVEDKKGNRSLWSGKFIKEYKTIGNGWTELTLPISSMAVNVEQDGIQSIEVIAHPGNGAIPSAWLELRDIRIDPGKKEMIDEYRFVKKIGNLAVYEQKDPDIYPEFGLVSRIISVENFSDLFKKALDDRKNLNQNAYYVSEQNQNKDFQELITLSQSKIKQIQKISGQKYYLELFPGGSPSYFILSHGFNQDWKLIPDVSKTDLNNGLISNIKLLGKSYLGESNHYVANGYANLWRYSGKSEEVAIVYRPQILLEVLVKVSYLSVFVFAFIISLISFQQRIWKKLK